MNNAELINELRYCFATHRTAIPLYVLLELEARLPKEGEWVGRQKHRRCSICGFSTWYDFALDRELTSPFCPECGARMKGAKHDI